MGRRLDLHAILVGLTPTAYFQPPSGFKMSYPCIVYSRDNADTKFAGNVPYSYIQRYQVTLIDPNPDSLILEKIARLPQCIYNRHYKVDNLNHDVFTLYF